MRSEFECINRNRPMLSIVEDIAGPLIDTTDALRLGIDVPDMEIVAAVATAVQTGSYLAHEMDRDNVWLDTEYVNLIATLGIRLVDECIARRPEDTVIRSADEPRPANPARAVQSAMLRLLRALHVESNDVADIGLWWRSLQSIATRQPFIDRAVLPTAPGQLERFGIARLRHGCLHLLRDQPHLALPHFELALAATTEGHGVADPDLHDWSVGLESPEPTARLRERRQLTQGTMLAIQETRSAVTYPAFRTLIAQHLVHAFPTMHPTAVGPVRMTYHHYRRGALARTDGALEPAALRLDLG